MRETKPETFLISAPRIISSEVEEYLASVGAEEWYARVIGKALDLGVSLNHAETLVEIAGRLCYRSWVPGLNANVTKIREASSEYLANILASGHGSVLEHAQFTFVFHNVSRVFTAEMNRHRAGCAISEQSMRFVRLTDIPFWWPEWTKDPCLEDLMNEARDIISRIEDWQLKAAETFELDAMRPCNTCEGRALVTKTGDPYFPQRAATTLDQVFGETVFTCSDCNGKGEVSKTPFSLKKFYTSFMRRLAPLGFSTEEVWSGNIRAIRHVVSMRTAEGAEEEIRIVAGQVAEIMSRELPNLFGDFEQSEESGAWQTKNWKV